MKFNLKNTLVLSSALALSFLFSNNLSHADEDFQVYYYQNIDLDNFYKGSKKFVKDAKRPDGTTTEYNDENIVSISIDENYVTATYKNGKSLPLRNKFFNVEDITYYAGDDAYLVGGLRKIDGKYYYFDANFELVRNAKTVTENRYIASDDKGVVSFLANEEVEVDGIVYVTDKDGYLSFVDVDDAIVQEGNDMVTIEAFEGLSRLQQNSDLMSPTGHLGLSSDQLKDVINTAFPNNKLIKDNDPKLIADFTETLVAIEDQLGINPFFILGIINAENPIMNGKFSQIVKDKNNLMSRNAYDDDPYGKATKFNSYAAAIVLPAKFLRINYLDPDGMYYVDGTVRGVNKHYATAKNRNNNVSYGMGVLKDAKNQLGY